jgi:hypothetical protein
MWKSPAVLGVLALVCVWTPSVQAEWVTVDFEDVDLGGASQYNGADGAGGFTSRLVRFETNYNPAFGSWDGFAASEVQNVTDGTWANQYASFADLDGTPAGGGAGGAGRYAVGYHNAFGGGAPRLVLPVEAVVRGAKLTNTTYAARTMLDGNAFAKAFGGPDGTDPDWLLLTVTGYDAAGRQTGQVSFDLADYSDPDGTDRLVDNWTWRNLQPLGAVKSLEFAITGSDMGEFGLNTPSYFALDDLVYDATNIPEPAALAVLGLGALSLRRRPRAVRRDGP